MSRLQDLPEYQAILSIVLKSQIRQLVEQLSNYAGEEAILLSASLTDGTLSHIGSKSGEVFLSTHSQVKSQFLGFCLERHQEVKGQQSDKPAKSHVTAEIPVETASSLQCRTHTAALFSNENGMSNHKLMDEGIEQINCKSDPDYIELSPMDVPGSEGESDTKTDDNTNLELPCRIPGNNIHRKDRENPETNASRGHETLLVETRYDIEEGKPICRTLTRSGIGIDNCSSKYDPVTSETRQVNLNSDCSHRENAEEIPESREVPNAGISSIPSSTFQCKTEKNICLINEVENAHGNASEVSQAPSVTLIVRNDGSDETLLILKEESDNDMSMIDLTDKSMDSEGSTDASAQGSVVLVKDEHPKSRQDLFPQYAREKNKSTTQLTRNNHSLAKKYAALLEVEAAEKPRKEIAKDYGIGQSTLCSWIKVSEQIKESYHKYNTDRRKTKCSKFPDVESALMAWLRDAKVHNLWVSSTLVREKANEIARDLGYTEEQFLCTNRWAVSFKARIGLTARKYKKL